jgi:outer membrane immunogenic protein
MSKITAVWKLFGAASALAFAAGAASAADLGGSIKDSPVAYSAAYNWTGLYVGTHAGLAVGQAKGTISDGYDRLSTEPDLSGGVYGGQIGYNFQRNNLVFGIEGSVSGANINGSTGCLITCTAEIDWTASIVGRAGMAFDRTLIYSLAGVAFADVKASADLLGYKLGSFSDTHTGWVVGFGVEQAITDRISAKLEYTHTDYGSETHNVNVGSYYSVPVKVDAETDTVKLGVNIKLTQ